MANTSESPNKADRRGPGRPPRERHSSAPDSEPPQKKRRYIPGGPGGGGRYVDSEGNITNMPPKSTPGSYIRPRGRPSSSRRELLARTPASRSRRDRTRPVASSRNRDTSAAEAAAAAMAQNDNKPREERGWEEYHPDLDIGLDLMPYSADQVDGRVRPAELSKALEAIGDDQKTPTANGYSPPDGDDEATPTQQTARKVYESDATPTSITTPIRRGPGRPPRRPQAMLHGLGSPPTPRIEPLPVNSREEKLRLTKATFRQVETYKKFEDSKEHASKNFVDKTLSNIGYQETDRVMSPNKYEFVRAGEGSIEEELDLIMARDVEEETDFTNPVIGRVEYDMDEQDEHWLEETNSRRKEEGVEAIKPAVFEMTMTQIEKEWHALEIRQFTPITPAKTGSSLLSPGIPKLNHKPAQTHRPRSSSAAAVNGELAEEEAQDQACAICDDGDCDNSNAILFCDGCDLAVHQECYGVPFVPEGQWHCRKCQHYGRTSPTCVFCPHNDGAFKQTTNAKWAHLLCALWIPEVTLGNTTFMEPIMDVEKVPKQRWNLRCYICQQKWGACVQCSNKNCFTAFHVTCARKAKLFLKMKSQHGGPERVDQNSLKALCDRHVPSDWRRENDVANAIADAKESFRLQFRGVRWGDAQNLAASSTGDHSNPANQDVEEEGDSTKRKREKAIKNVWRLPCGAPVVPAIVYTKVETSLLRFTIRKRKEFAAEACKYWTLKREARRGAALLKRLQMQRDTYSSMDMTRRNFKAMGAIGRVRLHNRINFAEMLEEDVDEVLKICEAVFKREQIKAQDAEVLKTIVETTYFPMPPLMTRILAKVQLLDAGAKDGGPKWFTRGLRVMQSKLEERFFMSIEPFCVELEQVFGAVIVDAADPMTEDGTIPAGLNAKQKEIKKVAKRINSRIKDMVAEAQRVEADLSAHSVEREPINLDALLERNVRERHGSVLHSVAGSLMTELEPASPSAKRHVNGHAPSKDHLANGDVEMHDADAPTINGVHIAEDKYQHTDEAIIRLQLMPGAPTIPITNADADHSVMQTQNGTGSSSSPTATAPALSASGSTNPSVNPPGPLTPPDHHVDTTNNGKDNNVRASTEGGVPWYLEAFQPYGTTVYEERWDGRDVMRGMSEDLSSLGDEAMDLLDAEVEQESRANGALAAPGDAEEAKKKARKKNKAIRNRRSAWGG